MHNLAGLAALAVAGARSGKGEKTGRGLWLVHEAGRVVKVFDSENGIVLPGFKTIDSGHLEQLAQDEGAGLVVALEKNAIAGIAQKILENPGKARGVFEQGFDAYEAVREAFAKGSFKSHPAMQFKEIDRPKIRGLSDIFKAVAPKAELLILAVFDDRPDPESGLPIFTSLILRLSKNLAIDLIATVDSLVPFGLNQITDWKKDYKLILRLAEKNFGPVFAGLFTTRAILKELSAIPPREGLRTLASLTAEKKIIIDPLPLKLRLLLKAQRLF
jgi:hypothetical protein